MLYIAIVLSILIWGSVFATYYLEKLMYFQILIMLLAVGAIFQYFAFDLTERNWLAFKAGLGTFCTVIPESISNGFVYSPWHELDNLYRYNEWLISKGLCSERESIQSGSTIPITEM